MTLLVDVLFFSLSLTCRVFLPRGSSSYPSSIVFLIRSSQSRASLNVHAFMNVLYEMPSIFTSMLGSPWAFSGWNVRTRYLSTNLCIISLCCHSAVSGCFAISLGRRMSTKRFCNSSLLTKPFLLVSHSLKVPSASRQLKAKDLYMLSTETSFLLAFISSFDRSPSRLNTMKLTRRHGKLSRTLRLTIQPRSTLKSNFEIVPFADMSLMRTPYL
mmetsp:Transcript_84055/g.238446  ORF Transcript_84055/g.238446 Transcript_84055/m.238446 type:complete len:214 (-) Transcript_84055:614-1255(-)